MEEITEVQSRKKREKSTKRKVTRYAVLFTVIICLCFIVLYGNTALQTTIYEVVLPKEYEALEGYTIVQISDLHNARFGRQQERLMEAIEQQTPHLIVITGDLIDSSHTDIDVAMDFVRQAVTIAPIYYVPGNHEAWAGSAYRELKQSMENEGVHILENNAETIECGESSLCIIGVKDPDMQGNQRITAEEIMTEEIKEMDMYTVLLSHRPELFETYVKSEVNLVFSGHAHGGQIRIPFIGGIYAPNQGFFPKYTEGVHTQDNTSMIVSRGIGNSVIPIRVNNRPELVVVTLVRETP